MSHGQQALRAGTSKRQSSKARKASPAINHMSNLHVIARIRIVFLLSIVGNVNACYALGALKTCSEITRLSIRSGKCFLRRGQRVVHRRNRVVIVHPGCLVGG